MYKLKDEDIISAYVHMDESTPHMHFYFIPVAHGEKDRISWDAVMPRKMYQTQHRVLQKYLTEQLQTPVHLLNGKTKGIDVQSLTAAEKQASMRAEQQAARAEKEEQRAEQAGLRADYAEQRLAEAEAGLAKLEQRKAALDSLHGSVVHAVEKRAKTSPYLSPENATRAKNAANRIMAKAEQTIRETDISDLESLLKADLKMSEFEEDYKSLRTVKDRNIDDLLDDLWER